MHIPFNMIGKIDYNYTVRILITILTLLSSLAGYSQFSNEELVNLYYSNDNNQITRLYFIDAKNSLAIKEGRKLALLKDGLVSNEIDISKYTASTWESVVNVETSNDTSVLVLTRQNVFFLTIRDSIKVDTVRHIAEYLTQNLSDYSSGSEIDLYEKYCLMGIHMDTDFGQIGIPGNHNSNKADYPPSFWIADSIGFNILNHEREANISKDRYREGWYHWPCRFNRDYTIKHDSVIFISVKANKLFIYDIGDKSSSIVKLPDLKKSKSWYYYYDHVDSRDFYVNKVSKKEYTVYQVTDEYREINKLATLDYQPTDIINSKIYKRRLRKEGKKRIIDHFLIPLYSSDQTTKQVLENVQADSDE
jgi:hypothetical protein